MAKKIEIIVIESCDELKHFYHKHPIYLHSRIRMLFLIKSGITNSTKELADKLMTGTRIIQTWKRIY